MNIRVDVTFQRAIDGEQEQQQANDKGFWQCIEILSCTYVEKWNFPHANNPSKRMVKYCIHNITASTMSNST